MVAREKLVVLHIDVQNTTDIKNKNNTRIIFNTHAIFSYELNSIQKTKTKMMFHIDRNEIPIIHKYSFKKNERLYIDKLYT